MSTGLGIEDITMYTFAILVSLFIGLGLIGFCMSSANKLTALLISSTAMDSAKDLCRSYCLAKSPQLCQVSIEVPGYIEPINCNDIYECQKFLCAKLKLAD